MEPDSLTKVQSEKNKFMPQVFINADNTIKSAKDEPYYYGKAIGDTATEIGGYLSDLAKGMAGTLWDIASAPVKATKDVYAGTSFGSPPDVYKLDPEQITNQIVDRMVKHYRGFAPDIRKLRSDWENYVWPYLSKNNKVLDPSLRDSLLDPPLKEQLFEVYKRKLHERTINMPIATRFSVLPTWAKLMIAASAVSLGTVITKAILDSIKRKREEEKLRRRRKMVMPIKTAIYKVTEPPIRGPRGPWEQFRDSITGMFGNESNWKSIPLTVFGIPLAAASTYVIAQKIYKAWQRARLKKEIERKRKAFEEALLREQELSKAGSESHRDIIDIIYDNLKNNEKHAGVWSDIKWSTFMLMALIAASSALATNAMFRRFSSSRKQYAKAKRLYDLHLRKLENPLTLDIKTTDEDKKKDEV